MKKISRRSFLKAARATAVTGTFAAVSGSALSAGACFAPEAPADGYAQTITINGFAWGPAVTSTVIELANIVRPESVRPEDFVVTEIKSTFSWMTSSYAMAESPRVVTAATVCTAKGEPTKLPSRYIRLDLYSAANIGSPFCFDGMKMMNVWCDTYCMKVELAPGAALTTLLGSPVTELKVDPAVDFTGANIPEMDAFDLTGSFTGSDGKTLTYACYEPAKGDKLPLVIWLHGMGEGGTDPSVVLLGNEVTPLAEKEFQDAMGGAAYILTPQTPGFWLQWDENDSSSWGANPGVPSIYTQTLKELIENFVAQHPRVDPKRVIIGGCSNGGYMAFNMVLHYPQLFAAAYPICEAYDNAGITDAELEGIRDLPIWFVFAKNDTIVTPSRYEEPTIARLKAMGANVHTSIFENVTDLTGINKNPDGSAYQYDGHYSWVYFFENRCTDDVTGENMWNWMGKQSR